jgi:hypothetical protein
MATCYMLDGLGIEFQAGGKVFTHIHTSPGAHLAKPPTPYWVLPGSKVFFFFFKGTVCAKWVLFYTKARLHFDLGQNAKK